MMDESPGGSLTEVNEIKAFNPVNIIYPNQWRPSNLASVTNSPQQLPTFKPNLLNSPCVNSPRYTYLPSSPASSLLSATPSNQPGPAFPPAMSSRDHYPRPNLDSSEPVYRTPNGPGGINPPSSSSSSSTPPLTPTTANVNLNGLNNVDSDWLKNILVSVGQAPVSLPSTSSDGDQHENPSIIARIETIVKEENALKASKHELEIKLQEIKNKEEQLCNLRLSLYRQLGYKDNETQPLTNNESYSNQLAKAITWDPPVPEQKDEVKDVTVSAGVQKASENPPPSNSAIVGKRRPGPASKTMVAAPTVSSPRTPIKRPCREPPKTDEPPKKPMTAGVKNSRPQPMRSRKKTAPPTNASTSNSQPSINLKDNQAGATSNLSNKNLDLKNKAQPEDEANLDDENIGFEEEDPPTLPGTPERQDDDDGNLARLEEQLAKFDSGINIKQEKDKDIETPVVPKIKQEKIGGQNQVRSSSSSSKEAPKTAPQAPSRQESSTPSHIPEPAAQNYPEVKIKQEKDWQPGKQNVDEGAKPPQVQNPTVISTSIKQNVQETRLKGVKASNPNPVLNPPLSTPIKKEKPDKPARIGDQGTPVNNNSIASKPAANGSLPRHIAQPPSAPNQVAPKSAASNNHIPASVTQRPPVISNRTRPNPSNLTTQVVPVDQDGSDGRPKSSQTSRQQQMSNPNPNLAPIRNQAIIANQISPNVTMRPGRNDATSVKIKTEKK